MRFHVSAPIVTIALIILGCSPRSNNVSHVYESSLVDGVLTVTNRGGPKYTEPLFRYEEVLRLKEDPDNEDSFLFMPLYFVQDEKGNFYVVDRGRNRIAVFDQGGNFVQAIGRSGDGPGEFSRLSTIFVYRGIIQAYDRNHFRLTRFDTDGKFIDVTSLNRPEFDNRLGSPSTLSDVFLTTDNRLILISQESERTDDIILSGRKVMVMDSDWEVAWQAVTPLHLFQSIYKGYGALTPYASMARIQYEPSHGILISPADEPTLLLYNIDGNQIYRISIGLEAKPITAKDRARVLDSFDQRITGASERLAVQLRRTKEGTIFPDRWPYWEGARLDNYGYMWLQIVEHEADREAEGGGFLYMVLSPNGEYLGDIRLPSGIICYGRLLALSTDEETGDPNLIVYQLYPAIEGFTYP